MPTREVERTQEFPRYQRPTSRRRRSPLRSLLRVVAFAVVATIALAALALGLLALAIYWDARHDETAPADAIIVLGTAQWNGRPSTTLRARLDHALELYRQGYAPLIVLTGGVGTGDTYSEAEVGRDYLREQGVPDTALLAVPAGRTSYQSLAEARNALAARAMRRVLLVSDPFHMFRVKRMASDLGLSPLASPTQTSPIRKGSELEYRYMARELAAYLAYIFVRQ
ncbi:MAG: YdcF family protein [Thermomicrobiaceae bacterium]|nr:YdcF family protein [Thermomicrobiaceae bacterium]